MVSCEICGREFETIKGGQAHAIQKHQACLIDWQECIVCGKQVVLHNSPRDTCSDECFRKLMEDRLQDFSPWDYFDNVATVKEEMSESHKGSSLSEEHIQAIRDGTSGRSEEYKRKMSEIKSQHWADGKYDDADFGYDSDRVDHNVRSSWEGIFAELLIQRGVEYEYEPEVFDIGQRLYIPDFIVQDVVVEVKGYPDSNASLKAEKFMEQYPEYMYVVVGPHDIISDYYFEVRSKDELRSKMPEIIRLLKG